MNNEIGILSNNPLNTYNDIFKLKKSYLMNKEIRFLYESFFISEMIFRTIFNKIFKIVDFIYDDNFLSVSNNGNTIRLKDSKDNDFYLTFGIKEKCLYIQDLKNRERDKVTLFNPFINEESLRLIIDHLINKLILSEVLYEFIIMKYPGIQMDGAIIKMKEILDNFSEKKCEIVTFSSSVEEKVDNKTNKTYKDYKFYIIKFRKLDDEEIYLESSSADKRSAMLELILKLFYNIDNNPENDNDFPYSKLGILSEHIMKITKILNDIQRKELECYKEELLKQSKMNL